MSGHRRVVVVTGGGNGIGAAIALELGRQGNFVVTLDPMVSLDGTAAAAIDEPTTADRIVAAGGAARAVNISVTDADAVNALFDDLVDEFRMVDGVINVAGISRPTGFAKGSEDDWRSVLDVHLNGYRNVLEAALPGMADARHGRILGVTSGSGWRPADAGAYGCAKRAVAALTWQLGWQAPPGVVVNAISPIAVTRMVTAALGNAPTAGNRAQTGGLALGAMPQPDELGPLGAYLVSDEFSSTTGEVIFAGGSEVAVVEPPRLLELVRTDDVASLSHVLATVGAAFAAAESSQRSGGGSNPRFAGVFDAVGPVGSATTATCAVVASRRDLADALVAALEERGTKCVALPAVSGFAESAASLARAVDELGALDAVMTAFDGPDEGIGASDWERTLVEHEAIADAIHTDAGWARAVADYATSADRALRLVVLTDATRSAGATRAQAFAQLARASTKATGERVAAFAVSVETRPGRALAEFGAYLACDPAATALAGAELVAADGWVGLRSHPSPSSSLVFGGPAIPDWFGGALRHMVR